MLKVYRKKIQHQMTRFKETAKQQCAFCGYGYELEVDHKVPLRELITRYEKGSYQMSWQSYHEAVAEYQMLCRTCNQNKEHQRF